MINGIVHTCTDAEGIYFLADFATHVFINKRFDSIRNDALGALNVADFLMLTSSLRDLTATTDQAVVKVKQVASSVLQLLVVIDILDTWGLTDLTKFSIVIGVGYSPLISGALAACCLMDIVVIISERKFDQVKTYAALGAASTKFAEQVLVLSLSTQPQILLILAIASSSCGLVKVFISGV